METKKRLIDANTLKRHMIKAMELANVKTINKDDIAYAIDNADAVDAVEVVHAHWIFKHNPIDDPKRYFIRIVCSNCNLHTGQKSNYCPQCGAKMDGEDNVTNQNKT